MTLLHIVGLAPRAPVAVRIKPMRVYAVAHTSPALPSLLLLNTMQPVPRTQLEQALLAAAFLVSEARG